MPATGSRTTVGKWTHNYTEGLSGGCVSGRGNRVSAVDGRTLKSALGQVREDVRHQWQEAVFPLRWLHVVSTSPQFDELILVGKLCCWLRSSHQPTTFSSTIAPSPPPSQTHRVRSLVTERRKQVHKENSCYPFIFVPLSLSSVP